MTRVKRYVLVVLVCVFSVGALVFGAMAILGLEAEQGTCLTGAEFDNLTVFHIGGGSLASQLADCVEQGGGRVVLSPGIPEAAELGLEIVVVFGGEWFEQRVDDAELHGFLRLASSRGASIVMAGGTTSVFFEALDKARVYIMAVDEKTGEARNPVHFNPPLVGFRKEVAGHTGCSPSFIFSSAGSSPDVLAESLAGWLRSASNQYPES